LASGIVGTFSQIAGQSTTGVPETIGQVVFSKQLAVPEKLHQTQVASA